MENKDGFKLVYSAKEMEEIKSIRNKYAPPKEAENKMEQLRRLDRSVYSKAASTALTLGIIGALIMGTGMSLVMTDIGALLGSALSMTVGVGLGIIGMVLVCIAYPVYNQTVKKEREKIAPDILRLTDELMER